MVEVMEKKFSRYVKSSDYQKINEYINDHSLEPDERIEKYHAEFQKILFLLRGAFSFEIIEYCLSQRFRVNYGPPTL